MTSILHSVAGLVSRDMAVDLGTANTLVYVRGEGIVLDEPSVVAVNVHDGKALAVGSDAKRMIGRTPNHIQAIRPLKDGVIADFDVCERMLRHFIQKVHPSRFAKPRMVICVPSGITGVEKRAVQEAAEFTTEVAVISLGGVVVSRSVRVGGDELDNAIMQYAKKEHGLVLGERTSEDVKLALASAWPLHEEMYAEVRGRDLVTGLPKTVVTSTIEVREARCWQVCRSGCTTRPACRSWSHPTRCTRSRWALVRHSKSSMRSRTCFSLQLTTELNGNSPLHVCP